jgi:hypothetical protein
MAQIEMDTHEAYLAMEAVQAAALTELFASAQKGPAGESAEVRSKVLQRVASRIADTFIDPRHEHRLEEAELGLA